MSNFINKILFIMPALMPALVSATCHGAVDVGVFAGSRNATVKYFAGDTEKSKTAAGSEYGASFMVSPTLKAPFAFGLLVNQATVPTRCREHRHLGPYQALVFSEAL